jgi:HK97 family phage portal protein
LRRLADTSDLVRLAIETRKDQMCRIPWRIVPTDTDLERDARCDELETFLREPDREHDWATWLRMLLEDLLVIDAPTIYPRKTKGGGVYSLDLIDGGTIKRLVSDDGRTPMPPDPAYQQVLKGLPAVDYTREELLYVPRNQRTNRVYGFSPVEQIVVTVNIALRKQLHQLQFYTEGSAPDLMLAVPEAWQPEQIRQMQEYWDALLAGNTAERRKTRFIPGGMTPFDVKAGALKDEYDEWLARVICYCFSLPPTAFVKQMNRATAESSQDVALEEGLAPLMQWTKSALDRVIATWFGMPDLQFSWQDDAELDPKTRAEINQIYVETKVITPDEVRSDLGMEPLTAEQKAELAPVPAPVAPGQDPGQNGGDDPTEKVDRVVKKNAARSRRLIATAQRSQSRAKRFESY